MLHLHQGLAEDHARLRKIHTAPTKEAAEGEFSAFAERWEEQYPALIKSWRARGRSSCRSWNSRPKCAP